MGDRKEPTPPPKTAKPDPPPAPPGWFRPGEVQMEAIRKLQDPTDRDTELYGQRLDCLELAMRCVERWPPEIGQPRLHRADQATLIAEHFREYLVNGAASEFIEP